MSFRRVYRVNIAGVGSGRWGVFVRDLRHVFNYLIRHDYCSNTIRQRRFSLAICTRSTPADASSASNASNKIGGTKRNGEKKTEASKIVSW